MLKLIIYIISEIIFVNNRMWHRMPDFPKRKSRFLRGHTGDHSGYKFIAYVLTILPHILTGQYSI